MILTDFYLTHLPERPKKNTFFPVRKMSDVNRTIEQNEKAYVRRSNICNVCNCAKPLVGECC